MYGNIYPDTKWEIERQGCATSSEFHKLLTPGKRKMTAAELSERPKSGVGSKTTTTEDCTILSDGGVTYILEKVSELLTGTVRQFTSNSTDWGNDMEPKAAERLLTTFPDLEYFGNTNKKFFKYTKYTGGSPDATWIITKEKIVFEIKCPENPANHVQNLLLNTQEELKDLHFDYYVQLQKNMMCVAKELNIPITEITGMFVSFCPIMIKPEHQMKKLVVGPDYELMARIDIAVNVYETKLKEYVTLLLDGVEPEQDEEILHTSEDLSTEEPQKDYGALVEIGKELRKKANL